MALGEQLPDGRQALYLVTDNNANPERQTTRIYKLSVDLSWSSAARLIASLDSELSL
jgi:hypothetical protein